MVAASLIFTPLADKYGRRPIVMIGLLFQAIPCTLILFTTSRNFAYFCIFLIGLAMPMRVFVGFIYCMEFLPIMSTRMASATILGLDNLVLMFASLFFMYISKEWKALFGIGTMMAWAALALVYNMPESPKYLVNKNRFAEARQIITAMGTFNEIKHLNLSEEE